MLDVRLLLQRKRLGLRHPLQCRPRRSRRYVEVHGGHSISYVRKGSFGYCLRGEQHEMVAGSILVGYPGDEFMCTHEHHAKGDECLSFKLSPRAGGGDRRPGEALARRAAFRRSPRLPVLGELAQASAEGGNDFGIDEAGLALAARFVEVVSGRKLRPQKASRARPSSRGGSGALDRRSRARARSISSTVAGKVDLSPFHFLRLFKKVVGVSPHQYLVRAACGTLRACWPPTRARSPTSPWTSASPISPTSCAPSTAPPACRRAISAAGAQRRPQDSPSLTCAPREHGVLVIKEVLMYDHIGLKVRDLDASARFYEAATGALGLEKDSSGHGLRPQGRTGALAL